MPRIDEFDYLLPDELIAQEPLPEREDSRLLWLHRGTGAIEHRRFRELTSILREGDLLVMNDTRVTALRLFGHKSTGGAVEALLLSEEAPGVYLALTKPAKKLAVGTQIHFEASLVATVTGQLAEGKRLLQFSETPNLGQALARIGKTPLPPYINRSLEDPERYQTVIASRGGSAAAPTAGLHFSKNILQILAAIGVELATVTLDVGMDTFRPIQTQDLAEHRMHGERCEVPAETADRVAACKGRIIAVGTTTVRTLETMAVGSRKVRAGATCSKLFIQPGFGFQIVDGMFTNFHLPRTTMLVMISALSSRERVLSAYSEAVRGAYRFLSFGDSMLIL